MEEPMTTEANKLIARQFFEATNTGHGPEMVDQLLAPDFVLNGSPFEPNELKALYTWAQTEVPDWQFTIEDIVAEGDRVAVRLSVSGTPRTRWRRLIRKPLAGSHQCQNLRPPVPETV
jgi:hypothetical protein